MSYSLNLKLSTYDMLFTYVWYGMWSSASSVMQPISQTTYCWTIHRRATYVRWETNNRTQNHNIKNSKILTFCKRHRSSIHGLDGFPRISYILQGILRFGVSGREISVITNSRYHQVFLLLSYSVNLSSTNCNQNSHWAKFWLSFQVLQSSLFASPSTYELSVLKQRVLFLFFLFGSFQLFSSIWAQQQWVQLSFQLWDLSNPPSIEHWWWETWRSWEMTRF